MAASYKKLFKLLIDREMKSKDLAAKAGISPATLAKMKKDGAEAAEEVLYLKQAGGKTLVDCNMSAYYRCDSCSLRGAKECSVC